MYLGKRKIHNPEEHERVRKECLTDRGGAIFIAFTELEGLLNKTALAKQYFEKTQGWLSQKIHGSMINNNQQSAFTEQEAHKLAAAFRDIALRLNAHADEIEAVAGVD